jgi:hypothetical protein
MAITPITLLDGETSTGVGKTCDLVKDYGGNNNPILNNFTVQAILGGTANATAVSFNIEGSIDNDNWFIYANHTMSGADISSGKGMFHIANKPAGHLRCDLTDLAGGTNPTITVKAVGR